MEVNGEIYFPDTLAPEKDPDIFTGGCMGPRAVLDGMEKPVLFLLGFSMFVHLE